MIPWLANTLWLASCLPGWQRFTVAAQNLASAQEQQLFRYLRANARTEYGEKYGFSGIDSIHSYQARVPLTSYDDYTFYIERVANGVPSVLTSEPVRLFELSSGSTAASKLIPYTRGLQAEFQRGIAPWIYNLYSQLPALRQGSAYWSVTPLTGGRKFTAGGLPIGFESDSAYLGGVGQGLVNAILAVPDSVKHLPEIDSFRYATLYHLLCHPDLRLISVWNPTFLSLLLAPLPGWWDALLRDIAAGTLTLPGSPAPTASGRAADPALARRLSGLNPTRPQTLWPQLALLSCWADGPSTPYARRLAADFPQAHMQAKGLLATEAFVSFPLWGLEGAVLSANSHFFEFLDEQNHPQLAHQLKAGQAYQVVVTTAGGFYRYQLHDRVEVLGHWQQLPRLRFLGKADHISDWFGEKLEEHFVAGVLHRLFGGQALFAMLAPEPSANAMAYTLYLEFSLPYDPESIALALDKSLRANFHYDYCRKLGQLDAARVVLVTHGAETYLRACQERGQKLGNIKPVSLQKSSGWGAWFQPPSA